MGNIHRRVLRTQRLLFLKHAPSRFTGTALLYCCLLVLLSGCVSLLTGVDGVAARMTPAATLHPTATPLPLNTDSEIAFALTQKMSLDQKLGQMVISEFYGPTMNGDLASMVKARDRKSVV